MAVYMIGPAKGPYKIGFTENVAGRLSALQTGSPWRLMVHAVRDDWGQADEKRLHRKFASSRTIGEWFDCNADILLEEFGVFAEPDRPPRMSSESFLKWLTEMSSVPPHHGEKECASMLGLTDDQMMEVKVNGAPSTLALACRALLHRLEPYE